MGFRWRRVDEVGWEVSGLDEGAFCGVGIEEDAGVARLIWMALCWPLCGRERLRLAWVLVALFGEDVVSASVLFLFPFSLGLVLELLVGLGRLSFGFVSWIDGTRSF
jgi:hypothetical protein